MIQKKRKARYYKLERKKTIFRSRFFWDFILVLILIFLIFYLLFFSKVFRVQDIKIIGARNQLTQDLKKIIGRKTENKIISFWVSSSIFLIDSEELEKEILKEYPELKKANLKKKFPQSLVLEVEQRNPVVTLCYSTSTHCFLADQDGVIFKEIQEDSLWNNFVLIFLKKEEVQPLGTNGIPEDKIKKILEIYQNLQEILKIGVEFFTFDGKERLDVKTEEGWEIYFSLGSDISLSLTKLKLILEKEIPLEQREKLEYIDLRFLKAYYKYKNL